MTYQTLIKLKRSDGDLSAYRRAFLCEFRVEACRWWLLFPIRISAWSHGLRMGNPKALTKTGVEFITLSRGLQIELALGFQAR